MIRNLLKPLDGIIKDLPFVDRYGSLVQQDVSIVEVAEGVYSHAIYPATMEEGSACGKTDKLQMVPCESKKSIFYFEGLTDLEFREGEGKPTARTTNAGRVANADYRLVGWLNLMRLGETNMISHLVAQDLIGRIHGKNFSGDAVLGEGMVSKIKYKVIRQVNRDIKIFDRYAYGDKMHLLLYPFDYFALVIRVQATLKGGACFEYVPGEGLSCF